MARKKRKVGFYYITLASGETFELAEAFKRTLQLISQSDKVAKNRDISDSKFGFIDTIKTFKDSSYYHIIFKSAVHSFRPPLIDSRTVEERESPKRLQEGELNKTHIIAKVVDGDIVMLLEKFLGSININQIVNYLNHFARTFDSEDRIRFHFDIIPKDNFLEEVNSLSRVTCAEVYVDKQLIGSESLNYSDRINTVKHDIKIEINAKRNNSIMDAVRDIYAKLNGGEQSISKMRITGKNRDNNQVKIDTNFIEREEYVNPEMNSDTGEVISEEILRELDIITSNFR